MHKRILRINMLQTPGHVHYINSRLSRSRRRIEYKLYEIIVY